MDNFYCCISVSTIPLGPKLKLEHYKLYDYKAYWRHDELQIAQVAKEIENE